MASGTAFVLCRGWEGRLVLGKAVAINLSEEGDGSAQPVQYLLYNCILNFWSPDIVSWVAEDAVGGDGAMG